MQQTLEFVFQFHKDTEVRDLRDCPFDGAAGRVLLGNRGFPGVVCQLLQAQRDPATLFVHRENLTLDRVALLQKLI